jgi:hypothetical protein
MGEKKLSRLLGQCEVVPNSPFWIGDQVDVLNHVPVHEKPFAGDFATSPLSWYGLGD